MILGENAHFIFRTRLRKRNLLDRLVPQNFLKSIPAASYFLNGDGYRTKIYLQNYFSLFADSPDVRARWVLDVYSDKGKLVAHDKGMFRGAQGEVIELEKFKNIGKCGVLCIKIEFLDDELTPDRPLRPIYFTEFTRQDKEKQLKVISHSLEFPTAGMYSYDRHTTGLILPADCSPHLLIACGSLLKIGGSRASASGVLYVVNSRRETLEIKLPEIKESLGFRKIDLQKESPSLRTHVGDQPFSLRLKGRNILGKPFWILEGENIFLGDHL